MTHPLYPSPPLLPPPAKPHPIDVALAAISEVATELLTSNRPSRFAELQRVMQVAQRIQILRPAAGVEDVAGLYDGDDDGPIMMANPVRRRFNDAADLNTQIIMLAQNFLGEYTKTLSKKEPKSDSRMGDVMELESLMGLRMQLTKNQEAVPDAITARINCLLKRIGEPPHEPEPDSAISPDFVRRHPPDGAGESDGGRLGEPIAERAGGDDGAR